MILFSRGPPQCEADGLCELAAQPLWIVNTEQIPLLHLEVVRASRLDLSESLKSANYERHSLLHCFRTPPTRLQRFAKSIFNTKWVQLGIFDRLRILLLMSL